MKLLASPATNNAGKDGRAIVCHIINGLQVAGAETMLFRLLKHGSSENLSRVISLHDDSARNTCRCFGNGEPHSDS
jgi:hypothetical protein